MSVKAVVFDCFGVLVGTGFWNVYAAAGGDPVRDADFIRDMLAQTNSGAISNETFRIRIADRLGVTVAEYQAIYDKDEVPNAALLAYIRNELKPHYKIGLLSNANKGVVERKIPASDLQELFDDVIISAEVGLLKPDPRIFELSARRLGVVPEHAIFTDDHEEYVRGATTAGMRAIHYTGFEPFKTALARHLR